MTPLARGAWFDQRLDVARAELDVHFPDIEVELDVRAGLELLRVDLPETSLRQLARLSFVQALFAVDGDALRPLDVDAGFVLPPELVTGARYAGKTNERMTQLALNVALATAGEGPHKLLDPVAGRGTTLLVAARYGIPARGVERDPKALGDFRRIVKTQTKLRRIKHKVSEGSQGAARYVEFAFPDSAVRLISGDSREVVGSERFTLVVGDLPYGVQHVGKGGTRNPLAELAQCAPVWAERLKPGGAMVLVFNALQPKRDALIPLFVEQGLEPVDVRASHRMSASILRELAVFRKP